MTEIFVLNCKENRDFLLSQKDKISPARREKTAHAIKESAALLNIGAGVILSRALSLPMPIEYEKRQNGKPFIKGQRHFNISHSGDYVLCAVSPFEVGADIEKKERMRLSIFKRIFSPAEKERADALSGDALKSYLCTVWTKKESILKMTGEGLRRNLREICTETDGYFVCTTAFNEYVISVCTEKKDEIKITEIRL